jgi:hypothetical protein
VFIIFADIADQVGRTVINVLAVAGSAALGYGLTYVLIWAICRLTIQAQPPTSLRKILSVLGAIAAGVLAATLLFNSGGLGFGLGGGLGFGAGNSTRPETSAKNNAPVQPTQPTPPPTNMDQSRSASPLRVKVLGVKDKEEKFYVVDGEAERRKLKNIEQIINDRIEAKPTLRELIVVLRDENSAGYDSKAVIDLENAAQTAGLSVGYDPPKVIK